MKKNSEKRNRKIELSAEAIALRKMRDYRSMSVRDVGDLLEVSFTTVSHMENGRATWKISLKTGQSDITVTRPVMDAKS